MGLDLAYFFKSVPEPILQVRKLGFGKIERFL